MSVLCLTSPPLIRVDLTCIKAPTVFSLCLRNTTFPEPSAPVRPTVRQKELRKSEIHFHISKAKVSKTRSYVYNIIQFVVTLKSSVQRRKRVPSAGTCVFFKQIPRSARQKLRRNGSGPRPPFPTIWIANGDVMTALYKTKSVGQTSD